MSSDLPSSSCAVKPVEICGILLNNDYAKSVTVPEAKQHQDGYTIYKIILQAIRAKKTIDEDPFSFVAWKRFRDLYKLHRRIVIVHAQLYLKGVVPAFPKPDFFGRREPCVVEERRQASEQFLSFVVQNSVLCQCEAVLAFFSGADYRRLSGVNADLVSSELVPGPPPLSPLVATFVPRVPLTKAHENSRSLSESSDISEDLSPIMSKPIERGVASNSNDFLADFDPFAASAGNGIGSNYQLLAEAMGDMQISITDDGNETTTVDPDSTDQLADPHQEIDQSSSFNNSTRSLKAGTANSAYFERVNMDQNCNAKSTTRWRTRIADFFPRLSPSSSKYNMESNHASPIPPKESKSDTQLCNMMKTDQGLKSSQSGRPKSKRATSPGSTPTRMSSRRSSLDYVIQAAEFISSAQKAEEENAFDLSFTCYKSAVMLLLQGVQDEKDLNRRNAVRLKTAKYLKKAEKLYTTYIASDMNATFCLDGFTSRFLSNFGIIGFQSVYSELAQYKVVRILDHKVQLVQDSVSGEKYVIKFLDKSCYTSAYSPTKILDQCVPTRVLHMVKLVKFWDTDTSIILLLEYAAGGRLWNRLRSYFAKAYKLFARYYDARINGDVKSGHELRRRSGSVDNLATVKPIENGVRRRTRSGSDPLEKLSRKASNFSVLTEPFDDDDDLGQADRIYMKNEESLFAVYEQQAMRARISTEDSFSLDITPSPVTVTRRFSLLYAEDRLNSQCKRDVIDEVDELLLRKWIAQLTVALGYLHGEGVLCRDLNPDNLLLDDRDNIMLTYFCDWSGVQRPFNHRAARMLYSAPEVDGTISEPLTDAVDWWSLGVILYEIATGTPLHVQCPHGVGPNTTIPLPDYLSVELRDLINRLIRYDAEDRLGSCFGGVDEIKMHPFFMEFDWLTVEPS